MDQFNSANPGRQRALSRIAAIRQSLCCFTLGIIGLVPLIGLPFAFAAIVVFQRGWKNSAADWNPARRYLVLGMVMATLGIFTSVTLVWWGLLWWISREWS